MLAEGDGDSGDERALSTQICGMLAVHAMIEEEIFYPAARKADVDTDLLDEADIEHGLGQAADRRDRCGRGLRFSLRRTSHGARRIRPPSRQGRRRRAVPGVSQGRRWNRRDRRASSEAQGRVMRKLNRK